MRFKAVMYESLSMKNLAFIGSTLTKLTKNCVFRVNKSEMSFLICEENSSPKQVIVWCFLEARQFYNEYVVEAEPPLHDIYLEFPTEMFSSSLSSLKGGNSNARSVKIKLTHKISPCLTIEIELMSDIGLSRTCVHDIPVKVLPKALWNEVNAPPTHDYSNIFDKYDYSDYLFDRIDLCYRFQEWSWSLLNVSMVKDEKSFVSIPQSFISMHKHFWPTKPSSQTVIELRNLKKMRSVLERLKKLCSHVSLKPSNESSALIVSASTHTVTVNTIFKNVVFMESSDDLESEVRVDVKRLCTLLHCEILNPKKSSCSFLKNELVHMILFCELFQVHFYLTTVEE